MSVALLQHRSHLADGAIRLPKLPVRIWLLLSVHLLLNLLTPLVGWLKMPEGVIGMSWAFVLAEASLVAMVSIISSAPVALTLALTTVAFYWLLFLQCMLAHDWRPLGTYAACSGLILGVTLAACAALRASGFRLVNFPPPQPLPRGKPLRYTIAQLMWCTAIVSVLAGSARFLITIITKLDDGVNWSLHHDHSFTRLGLLIMGLLTAVDPVVMLWVSLAPSRCGLRSLGFFVALIAILACVLHLISRNDEHCLLFALYVLVQALVLWATLLVVRWSRYRLVHVSS